jgi:uncharacterized membrane protein
MSGWVIFCAAVIGGIYAFMSGNKLNSQKAKFYFGIGAFVYLLSYVGGVWMFNRLIQVWAPDYEPSSNNIFVNFVTFPVAIVFSMVIYGPIKRFGKRSQSTPDLKRPGATNNTAQSKPRPTERYNKSER